MLSGIHRSLSTLSVLLILLVGVGGVMAEDGNPPREPATGVSLQAAVSPAFTYQGQLKKDGVPVNGTCDFIFSLHTAQTGGDQIGNGQVITGVTLTNSLFTVVLNSASEFGDSAFTGEVRYLRVQVRCPAGGGDWVSLEPRQLLTAVPYAHSLRSLANLRAAVEIGYVLRVENTATTGEGDAVRGVTQAPDGYGVWGKGSQGYGVVGESEAANHAGVLAIGSGSTGTALEILDGGIRVTGAGIGTSTAVFVHQTSADNTSYYFSCIDHPLTNGDPNAILFVTYNHNPGGGGFTYHDHAIGVLYNTGGKFDQRWCICNQDDATMGIGREFNVLVVKP